MGLNHDILSVRDTYKTEWDAAQSAGDVKDAIATSWENLCAAVLAIVSVAESESRMGHKVLLNGIADGCAVEAAGLRATPEDWDDRRMEICHRRWLHLILSINPYGAIHQDWGD